MGSGKNRNFEERIRENGNDYWDFGAVRGYVRRRRVATEPARTHKGSAGG